MRSNHTLIVLGLLATMATAALAHGGATGIVKQRMDGMMAMGKALGAVADMFKGKTPFNPATVANSADIVTQHGREMSALFPDTEQSRNGTGTEALPNIWQDLATFNRLTKELEIGAKDLKAAALNADQSAVRAAFAKVAKTCSACHRDFRKPKN